MLLRALKNRFWPRPFVAAAPVTPAPTPGPGPVMDRTAIFHIGRCGSTVLHRMLNQTPSIKSDSEIYALAFAKWRAAQDDQDGRAFTDQHFAASNRFLPKRSQYLFEVKFLPDLDMRHFDGGLDAYLPYLKSHNTNRAIILRRNNFLRRLLSTQLAIKRGEWHLKAGEPPADLTAAIPVEQISLGQKLGLVEMLDELTAQYDHLTKTLHAHFDQVLTLIYEDDILHDPKVAHAKVLDFLGLPQSPADVTLQRIQTKPLNEAISNFAAVEALLTGTPHEWMLTSD